MKKNIKHIICILCLLLVIVMLCGCATTPLVTSDAPLKTEAEAWGTAPTVSEDEVSSDKSENVDEDNNADSDSEEKDDFTPATIPTVNLDNGKGNEETTDDEELVTKPDSGAFTYKSAALSGNNKKITGFKVLTEKPVAYELLEFELDVPKLPEGANVYRETDVDIEIEMVSSSGKKIAVDAFYFEEYSYTDANQLKGRTDKEPVFRFRVSPQGAGTWDFTVILKIKGEKVDTLSGYVNVAKREKGSQVLMVEPVRKQVFMTKAGEITPMVGENMNMDDKDYGIHSLWGKQVVERTAKCNQFGANYIRLWRGHATGADFLSGIYTYSQSSSAMWDYVFESIADMGVYMSMVLMAHSEIRQDKPVDCTWHESVWVKDNGGYIENAVDFFSDEDTKIAYKNYLRYVISRWSYNEYILCWEIFNEMDHSDAVHDNRYDDIVNWLNEISAYIRETDQNTHMVGNSCGMPSSIYATYNVFDFVYYHCYGDNAKIEAVAERQKNTWLTQKRPVLLGEAGFGSDFALLLPEAGDDDIPDEIPDNMIPLHQANWAGLMGGGAGTAMNWYYHIMDRKDFYWCYQVVSEIAKLIPFDDPDMLMLYTDSVEPSNDQIGAMGYLGADYAYIWFYDEKFDGLNSEETTFKNETAEITLKDGTYNVSWINTWTGVSISKKKVVVKNKTMSLDLPKWSRDVVVTITPAS